MIKLMGIALLVVATRVMPGCTSPAPDSDTRLKVEAQTFPSGKGWGYRIIINQRVFIQQPYIPVLEGEKEFATEMDARKTAQYVAQKIIRHERPALTKEELVQLGVAGR